MNIKQQIQTLIDTKKHAIFEGRKNANISLSLINAILKSLQKLDN